MPRLDNVLTTQRIDPILTPGRVATHVHSANRAYPVLGGSSFGLNSTSSALLRNSSCTSIPIREDKSNYWYPQLYFQWQNGTFAHVDGNAVMIWPDYLFSDIANSTTSFPEDFRMISGDPNLRTFDTSSFAQQAITFLCLKDGDASEQFNELPQGRCSNGVRAQINFPSCWDGKNVDSDDHRSHVAFLSTGPDNGTCDDPAFPYTLPRIFMEVYWITQVWDVQRPFSWTPDQPFVFANGDPTGYGYHADFVNGWDPTALRNTLDKCHCDPYGDPSCCAGQGLFTFDQDTKCYITDSIEEQTKGNLDTLPGANPVQAPCYEAYIPTSTPAVVGPVYVYGDPDAANPADPTYTALDGGAQVSTPTVSTLRAASTTNVTQAAQGTCIFSGGVRTMDAVEWRLVRGIVIALMVASNCIL
ncbi:hypothetical protein BD626DRAFT_405212 [Schizophyllum amplum]|uniref:DUF1996 domain-containing protein n=1 Tax=Schizophyllum amplum TaxID=97359 RepID=A0A550CAM9_9AGAR|nr:hypothetical protein BD626DRAFT_405212 [Auriculariopsis ampla]